MFKIAGFYIIPPIFGVSFSPMAVLVFLVLVSISLRKIYIKFFAKNEPSIVILTKDEFIKTFKNLKNNTSKENKEDENHDGN